MLLAVTMLVSAIFTIAASAESECSKVCRNYWLKMNDDNYLKALDRYNRCEHLLNKLKGETKNRYKKSLVNNIRKSSNYFINHTEMSPAEVIHVLHAVNRLTKSLGETRRKARTATSPPMTVLNCCDVPELEEEEEEQKEADSLTLADLKKYFYWKFLLYAFVALIGVQGVTLTILFFRAACSNLMVKCPVCPLATNCGCGNNQDWISPMMATNSKAFQTEAYPLLINNIARNSKNNYGTSIGKRHKKDALPMDLSSISSGIGSDSEFEALMNRKQLERSENVPPDK